MKIKNISCTQFAGIRDRNIVFDDGINVVYGKNESGKSTLANLISRTLFQNARIDGRKDKEFRELYFPGALKDGSITGDFADGKISFDTENGTYTLSKEWGADARCSLSAPEGIIRDKKTIDAVLKDVLIYGEGVYSDMLLSSQRNTVEALRTILDANEKTDAKQEIVNSVSKAFAESGGISIDAIEQAINAKIEAIGGSHWDFEKGMPRQKSGRWSTGLGEILKAYYALEDAKQKLDRILQTEKDFDDAAEKYNEKDAEVKAAEDALNLFNIYSGKLALRNEKKKSIERIEKELNRNRSILADWSKAADELEKAKKLQKEKADRELIDKYETAKEIEKELNEVDDEILKRTCPTEEEIKKVKTSQNCVAKLENKLCGMNLNAAIKLFEGHTIEIISLRTGEKIDVSNGNAEITEAVKISVPGVAEIQLSPTDADVLAIEKEIKEHKKTIYGIFEKYSVRSLEELENLAKNIYAARIKADNAQTRLNMILVNETFDELEKRTKNISGTIRPKEEIEQDILLLCGGADISKFVTAKETVIQGYSAEFECVGNLEIRTHDLETEFSETKKAADDENIPEKYKNIADTDAYAEALKSSLKIKQAEREEALAAKTSAAGKLELYGEDTESDPKEEFQKAERIFNETKSLLKHWLHISEVFKMQKEKINNNPMRDIADSLADYLGMISDNKISSEFPYADKLNMNIYSGKHLLDYSKLSEGTKETVSLAFRLAVLDHLFPGGGGVIVLDDPFADMDAERAKQSCKLIKECAKKHQVIFLTCHEEYLNMLGGNSICI